MSGPTRMDRRSFLQVGAAAAALAARGVGAQTKPRPNFLLIMADDMGYSDAGCYGGEIETPNLNWLAENGLRFSQHYSTARCWPSRACVLTGYYAQQIRRDEMAGVKRGDRPAWAPLLPIFLKPAGYRSYHSGKWHIDNTPIAAGFDRSYWLDEQDRFFSPTRHYLDDEKLTQPEPDGGYYATVAIADHAVKTLQEHGEQYADQPFFHYLAFTSPHFPLHALQEDIDHYRDKYLMGWNVARQRRWERLTQIGMINCPLSEQEPETIPGGNLSEEALHERIGPGEARYAVAWDSLTPEQQRFQATKMTIHAAMVHRMDREIGRVLDQLRRMGALDNTLVMFMADNGASAEQIIRGDGHDPSAAPGSAKSYLCLGPGWASAANTPFRLFKMWTNEGGVSSPFILHWPNGLPARGEIRHNPSHFIDIVPTILDLAGAEIPSEIGGHPVPPKPGRSLVPAFTHDGSVAHDYLWWMHAKHPAIRMGDWKAVSRDDGATWALFNVAEDRDEATDLAAQHPERLTELRAKWDAVAEMFREQLAE